MARNYSIIPSLQEQVKSYLSRRKPFPEDKTQLIKRSNVFRKRLKECLGDFPDGSHPLKPKVEYISVYKDDIVQERVIYETEPEVTVPAHIYRPKHTKARLPGVLLLQGWDLDKFSMPEFKANLARAGYIVLFPDNRCSGERRRTDGNNEQWNVIPAAGLVGRTFMGMNTYDNIRAIDYLMSRKDVAPEKIGVIGLCWGGMQAWTLGALDPRVKVVCPVCSVSTYETLIMEFITFSHHTCLGTYIPNLIKYGDIQDIIACIAPRPLLIQNNSNDAWFPVSGYEKVCRELEEVYKVYGCPRQFRHIIQSTTHDITDEFGRNVVDWFKEYL